MVACPSAGADTGADTGWGRPVERPAQSFQLLHKFVEKLSKLVDAHHRDLIEPLKLALPGVGRSRARVNSRDHGLFPWARIENLALLTPLRKTISRLATGAPSPTKSSTRTKKRRARAWDRAHSAGAGSFRQRA